MVEMFTDWSDSAVSSDDSDRVAFRMDLPVGEGPVLYRYHKPIHGSLHQKDDRGREDPSVA